MMTKTLSAASSVMHKLICLSVLALPLTACGSSSSDSDSGGKAGAGSVDGSSGATGSGTAGETGSSGATGSGGAAGSSGAGSASPEATAECNARGAALCHQLYACLPAADLASDPEDFGTDEADCATLLMCDPTDMACDAGQTYNNTQAVACVASVKALTCAQFTAVLGTASGEPDACSNVCQ